MNIEEIREEESQSRVRISPTPRQFFSALWEGKKWWLFLLSIAVSLVLYRYLFDSWKFAFYILATIAIHESGHLYAIYLLGVRVRGVYFYPFAGVTYFQANALRAFDFAFIGLAGPITGLISSAAFFLLWIVTKADCFRILCHSGAIMNLVNLIPIANLDGAVIGRMIVYSLRPGTSSALYFFSSGIIGVLLPQLLFQNILGMLLSFYGGMSIGNGILAIRGNVIYEMPPLMEKSMATIMLFFLVVSAMLLYALFLATGGNDFFGHALALSK